MKLTPFARRGLMASTFMTSLLLAGAASAQDAPVQAAPQDQTPATQETPTDTPDQSGAEAGDQEVVVTGSRIVSPNIVSLAPVQVVGETDIDQSGAINVQEVLLENPAFGTPGISRTNSAFATSGAGVATVDLRDLGSDRTLVLINSRRVVAGLPGSATVDLNVIPTQFVERIDVLTGGASSLYGSDAVAGVVNFIYKRNFSGLLAEGQYGITQRGDSPRYQVSLTGGNNFADDRGNLMVHLGYTKEGALFSRERANTRVDDLAEITYSYEPEDFGVERVPFFSSFVPQGRFDVNGTASTADDFSFDPVTGELFRCFRANSAPTCTGVNGGTASGPFGFNRQAFRSLAVPVERYLFATRGTFDVTDSINLFAEGTYAKTKSGSTIEPFPTDSTDIFESGRVPIETLVNGVAQLNPLVPTAIANAAIDTDGDGLRDIGFARRLSEVGNRTSDTTRDFYRMVVGLEGKFLDNRFNWDLSYNYGQTSENQTSSGQYNTVNARFALQGVRDVNDVNNNGSTTDVICADANARAQGCVPLNLFGIGSITPQQLAYIDADASYQTQITQQVVAANVSGALFELPAGPLGVAIGAEYRKEKSSEEWDALTNAGLNAGNALPDTEGSFNVKELYGEINVPILRDVPFFQQLNLRAAGRISDYSTVGNVKTYNVGADWAPIDAVRLRGTYARSVRAPNVAELFTGPSQTFPSGIQDPCRNVNVTGTTALAINCRAAPGVLANANLNNGVFTLTQADIQGISGFDSGNPDLDVEKSRSITGGVVINPRNIPALRNLVLSADYYNIRIKDAIVAAPRQFILNQCYQNNVQSFCNLIVRRPTVTGSNSAGSIEFINAPLINGGVLKVEGVDFVAAYRTNLDFLRNGLRMNARLAWTHILDAYTVPVPGAEKDPFKGEIGTAEDRVNGTLGFDFNKVGLSFTGTYISESYEDNLYIDRINASREAFGIGGPLGYKDLGASAQFYLDAQATFRPTKSYELFLGVDNLLDNDAPVLLNGTTYNVTGSDTAADVYDIFGRRYYAGVRLRF